MNSGERLDSISSHRYVSTFRVSFAHEADCSDVRRTRIEGIKMNKKTLIAMLVSPPALPRGVSIEDPRRAAGNLRSL